MSELREGEALFRAWRASSPAFVPEAGRSRFLTAFVGARSRAPARSRARVVVAFAAAAAIAAALILWWRVPSALRFHTASGEGQAGAWLATEPSNELALSFSEGTSVVLAKDSRGRVEELGRSGAVFLLERGEVRAKVVHRASTDWRFRAGPFEVKVTGTSLGVAWDPAKERLAVRVDEGAVVVEGPSAGASQVVRAGEECVMDVPARTTRLSSIAPEDHAVTPPFAPAPPPPPEGTSQLPDPAPAPRATEPAPVPASPEPTAAVVLPPPAPPKPAPVPWTKLEERGDYPGAYAAASHAGWASVVSSASADELLRLAQVGRVAGHADAADRALLACRQRFPGTERAAVAAYELGRGRSGGAAAAWFETYLREAPSGALAREALGRLVESLSSGGQQGAAKDAASRYLARYPGGPHAALARKVLGASP